MTEVSETYFKENIQSVSQELQSLQEQHKALKAKHQHNCSVDVSEWCGDTSSYKEHLTLKKAITFLQGRLEMFQELFDKFLKNKSGEVTPSDDHAPTDPTCDEAGGCSDPVVPESPELPESDSPDYSWLDKMGFQESALSLLGKKKGDVVNEERLQHATIEYVLENLHGPDVAEQYLKARQEAKNGTRIKAERANREALRALIENGTLTREQAEWVNGLTFRAAQLDGNHSKLGDSSGPDAVTMGVMRATDKAYALLEAALRGEYPVASRAL
ncbi:MAG: hypothetical protein KDD70_05745 [Bdellovibrionales bacterium]|nr:hypothetical protein [Bdellovibrionales bacterium]